MVKTTTGRDHFVKFGEKGISDIIGFLRDGRFLAVEIKRPEYFADGRKKDPAYRLSGWQRDFLEMVAKAGGVAIVADDAEELAADLRGI